MIQQLVGESMGIIVDQEKLPLVAQPSIQGADSDADRVAAAVLALAGT